MTEPLSMDPAFISKLTDIVLANFSNENFGAEELANKAGMSRANLYRRLQNSKHEDISQFIREVRLNRAMEMLLNNEGTASEISFKVGFGSPAYFSKCFHDYYGFPPGEARKRDPISPENVPAVDPAASEAPTNQSEPIEIPATGRGQLSYRNMLITSTAIISGLLLIFFFYVFFLKEPDPAKSIAVLPFKNDSTNDTTAYFINGLQDKVLNNLQVIKELRVISRTSVEQYRNTSKSVSEIARELGVNYILEGSGQKYGNSFSVSVQLIRAKNEDHLWGNTFEEENTEVKNIFDVQNQIAYAIAGELKATITPEEKQLINTIPTTNMGALNMCLQGSELMHIAQRDNNKDLYRQAEAYFKKAIQLDSTYSDAYWRYGRLFETRNDYDSVLYLANRALHFDDKNSKAYSLKALACYQFKLVKETEDAAKLSLKYNPNDCDVYNTMALVTWQKLEYGTAIKYILKAIQLEKEHYTKSDNLRIICMYLNSLDFWEEGLKYAEELIRFDNDSLYYYMELLSADIKRRDYPSALRTALKLYGWHWDMPRTNLINHFIYAKDYKGALKQVEEYIKIQEKQLRLNEMFIYDPSYVCGYVYLKNGQKEKSVYYFERAVKDQLKKIEQDQPDSRGWDYYLLAGMYSGMDDKDKAIESLRKALKYKDIARYSPWIIMYKFIPQWDAIRDEPEFQELFKRAEAWWLPERKKIEKVLKEEGIFK
jgi:TolB-like protein/AraC-like DNA-binding protein